MENDFFFSLALMISKRNIRVSFASIRMIIIIINNDGSPNANK